MVPGMSIKVLLVDDNENNLLSMQIVLENDGYTFFKATSGREALRILLKESDFSLILLDVRMPIMDGYETAELIYQRDKLKHIPIIFFTAHDYEESAVFKGYQAGAVDFIRKPFNPEILRAKVAIFAELHRKNQLLRQQEQKLQQINNDLMLLNQDLEKRVLGRTIELENLNRELKALNSSKDKFISVISHDLRNPVTALLLASEELNRQEGVSLKDRTMLSEIIHVTANNILQQLNELVEWAKKQFQKTSFNPEDLQLIHRVNESLDLLKANALQKSIELQNAIPEHIYVKADCQMLRSILQNIVTNAIKFTPQDGGPVVITARLIESMVEISVQDSGTGMSKEVKDMISGNLRSSSSMIGTNQEKGSGLGLLLVKDFVTQHGGTTAVDSELGKGTCFRFTLPAVK
jgi:signal transduction histidine kinase